MQLVHVNNNKQTNKTSLNCCILKTAAINNANTVYFKSLMTAH